MITPEQITNKKFTTRFGRGYDQDEVDAFLDAVEADYVEVLRGIDRAAKTAADGQPSLGTINLMLKSAQTTADQLVVDANKECARVIAQAKAHADELLAGAREEAKAVVADGQEKRHAAIGALESQRADIARKVTGLQELHRDLTGRLKDALLKLSFEEEK